MPEQSLSADSLQLPYSLEAEQSVLGCILMQPDCLNDVMDSLRADHFYLPEHQAIYRVMVQKSLQQQAIDLVTVAEALKADGFFSTQDGRSYLFRLAQTVPSIANVGTYARIVREKAQVRQLITAARGVIDQAMDPGCDPGMLLDFAEQQIYDIREGRSTGAVRPINEVLSEAFETYTRLTSPERDLYAGISTGIQALDNLTTGLNRSDLIIVGARPGMGKTSFALNIAAHVADAEKRKVIIFNLEMSCEQMVNRFVSSYGRVSGSKLRTGHLSEEEWNRIASAGQLLCQLPIYLDDSAAITVPEMMSRVRRIRDVGLVVVDYLQLMQLADRRAGENRTQEVSQITRSLKIMAKQLNVPVLVCAQLSRATERQSNHRPTLADLRESGSIEQDADQVLFLYRDEYYRSEKEDPEDAEVGTCEVIVAKNRHGELGTVKLAWEGEYTTFTGIDYQHHEA